MDKKKYLTKADLERQLALFGFTKTQAEINEMWHEAAQDATQLEFDKFVMMIDGKMRGLVSREMLQNALTVLDKNEDGTGLNPPTGTILADTLETMLLELGNDKLTQAEVDAFMQCIRIDHAGYAKTDELFATLMDG